MSQFATLLFSLFLTLGVASSQLSTLLPQEHDNNVATRLHQRFLNTLEKRGLQEDDSLNCATAIVDWTSCLFTNCLSAMDNCEEEAVGTEESAGDDSLSCPDLKNDLCNAVDQSCCPACEEAYNSYADCTLQSLVYLCPDIGSCGDGTEGGEVIGWFGGLVDDLENITTSNSSDLFGELLDEIGATGANDTSGVFDDDIWNSFSNIFDDDDNATTWLDDDDSLTDDFFGEQFACVDELSVPLEECTTRNGCEESCGGLVDDDDSLFTDDSNINICDAVTVTCDGFQLAFECCPACQSEMTAFMTCYFEVFARDFCQIDSCGDITSSTSKNTESEVEKSTVETAVVSSAHSSQVIVSAVIAAVITYCSVF